MSEDATASAQEIITEQVSTEAESEWKANDLSDHEKNEAAKAGQPAKFPKDKVSEVIQTGKKKQKTKKKPAKKPANPKRPYASPVASVLTSSLKVNCMHTKAFCSAVVDKIDEDTGSSFGILKGLCNALGLKPNEKNVTPEACTKQYETFMAKQESLYKKGITHMQLRHIRRSMAKNGILVKNKKRKIEFNGHAVGLLDKLGPYDKVTASEMECRMAMKEFRKLFDQAINADPAKMAASVAAGLSKKQQKSLMRWGGDVAVPLLEDLMAAEAASLE